MTTTTTFKTSGAIERKAKQPYKPKFENGREIEIREMENANQEKKKKNKIQNE